MRRRSLLWAASLLATACVAGCAMARWFASDEPLDIYFLRHGETTWNRAGILQGSIAYTDLTERGVRMAEETARGLAAAGIRFDRIYSSPYLRAFHTAEIIAGTNCPAPVADARLREMCFGKYEGVRYKDAWPDDNLRLFFEDPERYIPAGDGAESFKAVGSRLRDFLEDELRPLAGKATRVLCVTHSLVLKSLVRELVGESASAAARATIQSNCCVHVVHYEKGKFTLRETGRLFYDPASFGAYAGPKLIAHRGAGDLTMPEASLPAFSNAIATACNVVKLDLRRTKDDRIVLSHDPTLQRTMGWNASITNLTYAELLENGRFLTNGVQGTERIVRLDQALAVLKPAPEFWLDFKNFTPAMAEKVMADIADAGIDHSRLMVATFATGALAYFQTKHPEIRRVGHISITHGTNGMWRCSATPKREFADKRDAIDAVLRHRDRLGLYGVNMPVLGQETTPEEIRYLRRNGLWVSLWFVQNGPTEKRYRDSQADAYVTDHVSRVRRSQLSPP